MAQVRVDIDTMPDDGVVESPGLGLCQNHVTKEVDDIQVMLYNDQRPEGAKFADDADEDMLLHVEILDAGDPQVMEQRQAEADLELDAQLQDQDQPPPSDLDSADVTDPQEGE
jgi:hypothetical protein